MPEILDFLSFMCIGEGGNIQNQNQLYKLLIENQQSNTLPLIKFEPNITRINIKDETSQKVGVLFSFIDRDGAEGLDDETGKR